MILSQSTPTAHRTHRCDWCGELIEPGERYHRYSDVHDGEMQTTKMHAECYAASALWFADDPYREGFDAFAFHRGKPIERMCECE